MIAGGYETSATRIRHFDEEEIRNHKKIGSEKDKFVKETSIMEEEDESKTENIIQRECLLK